VGRWPVNLNRRWSGAARLVTRDGRTFDFRQRHALLYHVAAAQPLVEIALYAPGLPA